MKYSEIYKNLITGGAFIYWDVLKGIKELEDEL